MPFLQKFVVLIILSYSTESLAAREKPESDSKAKVRRVSKSADEPTDIDESSNALRKLKDINAGILLSPVETFSLSAGASFEYKLRPEMYGGFSYIMGSRSINLNDIASDGTNSTFEFNIDSYALLATARFFLGNSFNMTSGLGIRSSKVNYSAYILGQTIDGTMNFQSIVLPVYLGNRWNFENGLTIGCDWIGAMIPIGARSESLNSASVDQGTLDDLNRITRDSADRLSKTTGVTLLLTHFGWSF